MEWIGLLTALLVLITGAFALTASIMSFRTRRQIQEVHVLVNSRMKEMVNRVNQLEATLKASDVDVPPARNRNGS